MHEVDRKLEEAMKKFNLDEVVAAYNRVTLHVFCISSYKSFVLY